MLGDPAVGTVVAGKYCVEARIAVGGMATILRARHIGLGEAVALKILLPRYRKSLEFVSRFSREARAAARLRSEHVARVLDFGMIGEDVPYLAMELLEGADLEAVLLERGPLPELEAIGLVLQACEALAEAHALGIVHRDLKPQNLFLTTAADGTRVLKVIDFGIAKTLGGRAGITTKHSSMGTPHYMSPEQVRGTEAVDTRTDIWSIGVILHELVTGKNVFDAANVSELLVAIATGAPKLALSARHSTELERILKRCLAIARDDRYASVIELADELGRIATPAAKERARRIRRVDESARSRGATGNFDAPLTFVPLPPRELAPSVPTMAASQPYEPPLTRPNRRRWIGVASVAAAVLVLVLASTHRREQAPVSLAAGVQPSPVATPVMEGREAQVAPTVDSAARSTAPTTLRAPASPTATEAAVPPARPVVPAAKRDRVFSSRK